jgi:hypothetical protein
MPQRPSGEKHPLPRIHSRARPCYPLHENPHPSKSATYSPKSKISERFLPASHPNGVSYPTTVNGYKRLNTRETYVHVDRIRCVLLGSAPHATRCLTAMDTHRRTVVNCSPNSCSPLCAGANRGVRQHETERPRECAQAGPSKARRTAALGRFRRCLIICTRHTTTSAPRKGHQYVEGHRRVRHEKYSLSRPIHQYRTIPCSSNRGAA